MSWWGVAALCATAYGLKGLGLLLGGRLQASAAASLALLVVPVLAALVVVQTLGDGGGVAVDERLPAVATAAVLVWRGAPLPAVVLAAAATAALLRSLGV